MYYVYLLVNEDGDLYTGFTGNLKRRMQEHHKGEGYTRNRGSWKLCYYEAFTSKKDALGREKALKQSSQSRRWLKERVKDSLELCRKS